MTTSDENVRASAVTDDAGQKLRASAVTDDAGERTVTSRSRIAPMVRWIIRMVLSRAESVGRAARPQLLTEELIAPAGSQSG